LALDIQKILALLEKSGRPMTRREISEYYGLDHSESDRIIKPLLLDLIAAGKVVRNRRAAYGLARNMDLVRGRISAHADGFGFVIPDEDGDDLYLSPIEMRRVFHGDRVLAAVSGIDRRGRKQGQIVEVVERAHERIVGRLVLDGDVAFVVPDDPRLTHDVLIPNPKVPEAAPGKIVIALIKQPPSAQRAPVGEIVGVLGHADEPGMATHIAIFNHGLPEAFPEAALDQAEALGESVDPARIGNRVDLRQLPLVTIDGADARDFDDAVHAEPSGDGYQLTVAIADVAEYVEPGSALDQEAVRRGTSTYFPDRVVPMLPEALSNGLCSLRPDVDRLVLVCRMKLDPRGKVISSRFFEAVMHSAARLTYEQAQALADGGDPELEQRFGQVRANLDALYKVYRLLAKRRARRGAIDFDSSEVRFVFDADGRVQQLGLHRRLDAHRLIEECMIAANVEAAKSVLKSDIPALYRVHDKPPPDKLAELETFLSAHGLKPGWTDQPEPADLTRIQRKARGTPIAPLVDAVLLRSMALAVYQPENLGHFGLALDAYAHFTSPIRRYPDLLLHRALKHQIRKAAKRQWPYSEARMAELGRECSWLERRAEDASREVDERLKCQFMQRHLGERFEGVITGVTSFGLFVEILEFGVSGLVHITELPNDYYHFDPVGRVLTGERRGLRYRLADPVEIEVLAVSVDERKIDFRIAQDEQATGNAGEKSGGRRRGKRSASGGGKPGRGKSRRSN